MDKEARVYAYVGPGKSYAAPKGSGYKPYKQVKLTVYFEENGWVLTDIEYQTAEERFVYFPKSSFDRIGSIPEVGSLAYVNAEAAESVVPVWGPDRRFGEAKEYTAEKGTDLKVYFRENGYVYAEYKSENGTVRMWLPDEHIGYTKAQ